ncbi:DUF1853 family protein [Methylobacterium organophilum]|nr:DUF1853 family protein [Methylobacterium organophilum]
MQTSSRQRLGESCDLVIVVGGDGSLLGAARAMAKHRVPVLGINRGSLGFLTDIRPDELEEKVAEVLNGQYTLENRFLLEAWLSQRSNRRLGLYYERLWQYALCQAPDIQLLAANLPIRQNGSTLGELDLLFCDDQGVHHLELAIKLYLGFGPGDGSQHAHWLGPGNHDRLDLKLAHLCQHQLPLCNQPATQAVLAELTGREVQSSFWLSGYLFQPWPQGCALPHGVNPRHLRGDWLRYVSEQAGLAMQTGVPVEGICLYPVLDYPGWADERHCPVGLLGFPDEHGKRCVHAGLADELRLQQARFSQSNPAPHLAAVMS